MWPSTSKADRTPSIAEISLPMTSRIATILLLGFVSCPSLFGQRISVADGVKSAVMRSEEIRVYSLLSADIAALDDLLTKDCLYVHSSGRLQAKNELLADLKSGALKYNRLQYTAPPLIRLFNAGTAVVTGKMQLEAVGKAGEVKLPLLITAVYVLQDERWQLASYHSATTTP